MPPPPSPACQSPREPLASAVSSPMDLSWEGPFDAYCVLADTGSHPLILNGLPGCPYHMMSYLEEDIAEMDPAFGVQLHHPRFLECIGAPESARLLGHSPAEWVQMMDKQEVMAAALQLQWDAGLMASNLQVLGQYVTSLNRMSSGGYALGLRSGTFPSQAVNVVAPLPRVHRAATHMSAMGLWRPPVGQGIPGAMPVSSCNNCTGCSDCSPEKS